jgi:hypothetical protein
MAEPIDASAEGAIVVEDDTAKLCLPKALEEGPEGIQNDCLFRVTQR